MITATTPRTYIKLWSLEPYDYKIISQDDAIKGYVDYLQSVTKSQFGNTNLRHAKSFAEWLDTEI